MQEESKPLKAEATSSVNTTSATSAIVEQQPVAPSGGQSKLVHVESKNILNVAQDIQTCFEIIMTRIEEDAQRIEELQDYWMDTNSLAFKKTYVQRREALTKRFNALQKTLNAMKQAANNYDQNVLTYEEIISNKLKTL